MSTEPAPRAHRRRVGSMVAAVLGLVLLWTTTQTMMCVSRYDQEMLRATDALRVQNWAGARTHFREAASSKMMDDVAVYGLYMAERLETETNLTEFEAAVKRGDFASARKVSDVETDPRRREVQIKVLERLTKNPE